MEVNFTLNWCCFESDSLWISFLRSSAINSSPWTFPPRREDEAEKCLGFSSVDSSALTGWLNWIRNNRRGMTRTRWDSSVWKWNSAKHFHHSQTIDKRANSECFHFQNHVARFTHEPAKTRRKQTRLNCNEIQLLHQSAANYRKFVYGEAAKRKMLGKSSSI